MPETEKNGFKFLKHSELFAVSCGLKYVSCTEWAKTYKDTTQPKGCASYRRHRRSG